jgi:hypothetical protein
VGASAEEAEQRRRSLSRSDHSRLMFSFGASPTLLLPFEKPHVFHTPLLIVYSQTLQECATPSAPFSHVKQTQDP